MGFVPIFITLGGFVFLFVMVVHINLKRKKKEYFALLQELALLNVGIAGKLGVEEQPPLNASLASQEFYLRHLMKRSVGDKKLEAFTLAMQKLSESKRLKYQYHSLMKTKPYSFVAKLMGHNSI